MIFVKGVKNTLEERLRSQETVLKTLHVHRKNKNSLISVTLHRNQLQQTKSLSVKPGGLAKAVAKLHLPRLTVIWKLLDGDEKRPQEARCRFHK